MGDIGQRLLELKICRGDQEQLGIGKALELDAERAPHCTARAVGSDQIAAGNRHRTRWCLSRHGDGVAVLPHRRDLVAEADVSAKLAQLSLEEAFNTSLGSKLASVE